MISARLKRPCRALPPRARQTLHGLWASVVIGSAAALEVQVSDWAAMPLSGNSATASGIPGYMSRVNFIRPEPGGSGRLWVCDLNGNLHIFDPSGTFASRSAQLLDQAKNRAAYLDFNGQSTTATTAEKTYVPNAAGTSTSAQAPNGLFPFFTKQTGFANGLVTFQFDPGYATNGKFYTVHIEATSPNGDSGRIPVTTKFPGLSTSGYTSTNVVNPPIGSPTRHAVLIEWTDTNRSNLTFEGSAREILRIGYNGSIHPLGDLTFNPTAAPGDAEYGVMYLASGDGKSGETYSQRGSPQFLSGLVGKILRIIPDPAANTPPSSLVSNGRYRIPNDNPFAGAEYNGARKEIWTLGHRNPHRFVWHVSEDGSEPPVLLVTEIGLNAWEELNILKPGRNYGYSEREGIQMLTIGTGNTATLGPRPQSDYLQIRLNSLQAFPGEFVPEYPVISYPHTASYGDAISNGFFYHGNGIPGLKGKFVFGDITTGRLFYCDWSELLAADDGNPDTTVTPHPITLKWNDPNDSPDAGLESYNRFFEIVEEGYDHRGGVDSDLPGGANVSGTGRADIRLAVDAAGELYVSSKSDGMIRAISGSALPQFTDQPDDKVISLGADTSFTVAATGGGPLNYQWQRLPVGGGDWVNVSNGGVFSGATTATLSLDSPDYDYSGDQFRSVVTSAGQSVASVSALLVLRAIPNDWLSVYFTAPERVNLEISGDMADPDKDGLVNLLEYAFDFNPEVVSTVSLPEVVSNGATISLSFPVPRSTLNYIVQRSTALEDWSTSGVTTSVQSGVMTASCVISESTPAFLRILVEPK